MRMYAATTVLEAHKADLEQLQTKITAFAPSWKVQRIEVGEAT